ncbi:MAG: hypothetical protein BWY74_03431 [Firmicutes bacterium ADurb.Bin419]|nr:MAG: hypothetical protein BWY74_03431 [Firmicutes bacterium ADurb.Bin419]
MVYEDIYNWHIDGGNLLINEDVITLGPIVRKETKAFIQSLDIIMTAILGKNNSSTIDRKNVDVKKIIQLIDNNCSFGGKKFKHFKGPHELKGKEHSAYSAVWKNNEQIIIVFVLQTYNYIITDSAFYYISRADFKRLALTEINRCEAIIHKKGEMKINNDILEFKLDLTEESIALLHSIENIICGIIDITTGLSSLKPIIFDDTITSGYDFVTKRFTEQLDENDINRAHQICLQAYTQAYISEADICVDNSTRLLKTKHYMDINRDEQLLFRYDNGFYDFYITNLKIGFYNSVKKKVSYLYLPQFRSITVKNVFGKIYMILNDNEDMAMEIVRPYTNTFALLFISLFTSNGNLDFASLINFIEQFKRLRLLTGEFIIHSVLYNRVAICSLLRSFDCRHQPDELLALWSSDRELLYLTSDKFHISQIIADGVILSKDFSLADIRNISVGMHWCNNNGQEFITTLVFGAILGSVLSGGIGNIKFSHSSVNINDKVYRFNALQARDAVLLKFLLTFLMSERLQSA